MLWCLFWLRLEWIHGIHSSRERDLLTVGIAVVVYDIITDAPNICAPHTSDVVILARYLDIAEIALLANFLLLILRGLLVSASDGALGVWLGFPHVGRDDEMATAGG